MGVLQRFERRLEGMVEGAFAKVFKGEVQPVEIAAALTRETDDKRAVVGHGRVLVPNDFVVELGERDHDRLAPYADALGQELAEMVKEHAGENGYSFVGSVQVLFERTDDLDTGVFRIRSGVAASESRPSGGVRHQEPRAGLGRPPAEEAPRDALPGNPRLVVSHGEKIPISSPEGRGVEETYYLTGPVTVIGRGYDADIRLDDPRVSRRHAEVRYENGLFILIDLDSTNGTLVNDAPVSRREIGHGDRIGVGTMTLLFRHDQPR